MVLRGVQCDFSLLAAAFDGLRTGSQGNRHPAAPALPGASLDHEYRALHGGVTGAVQGYLALTLGRLTCSGQSVARWRVPPVAFSASRRD
jgi:hypothetical protein